MKVMRRKMSPQKKIAMSYGGGTQSIAICVLILTERLPIPDYFVMADTSREMQATWEYLSSYVSPALEKIGKRIDIIPHSYSSHDLYQNDYLLIPAYTTITGKVGKQPTRCSGFWKAKAIRKWLLEQGETNIEAWLGISTDEIERMKPSGMQWYRHVYPLIEILKLSRQDCYNIVAQYGWPRPPKSACWMCPHQNAQQWQILRDNYPADFARAVEFENDIRKKNNHYWLHRKAKPLAEAINESDKQPSMFDACESGYCMV